MSNPKDKVWQFFTHSLITQKILCIYIMLQKSIIRESQLCFMIQIVIKIVDYNMYSMYAVDQIKP